MSKVKNRYMNDFRVILYNDEHICYYTGAVTEFSGEGHYINYEGVDGRVESFPNGATIVIRTSGIEQTESIKLDETMMRRIAKFNKEMEIEELDKMIKAKNKEIKALDELLTDKAKRWEKVKKYISKIYEIDTDVLDEWDEYDE